MTSIVCHICQICEVEMDITMEPYGEGEEFPTATCQKCGVSLLVEHFENEEMAERIFRYHTRELLERIIAGQKAIRILNSKPQLGKKLLEYHFLVQTVVEHPVDFPANDGLSARNDPIELLSDWQILSVVFNGVE